MSTSPQNDSHRLKLCRLSSKVPILAVFGTWKTPCTEFPEFFTGVSMWTLIHIFLFQKCFKLVQDKWPKDPVALMTKETKHILAAYGRIPGAISPIFLVSVRTEALHLYSRFHPDKFRFGEL